MSRTYRRQSGYRYWRDAHRSTYNFNIISERVPFARTLHSGNIIKWFRRRSVKLIPMSWNEIENKIKEDIIRFEKKDGYWRTSLKKCVKWHSNMLVRQSNRLELQRVLRDPENYDYNRDHDLRKRGLIWVYD